MCFTYARPLNPASLAFVAFRIVLPVLRVRVRYVHVYGSEFTIMADSQTVLQYHYVQNIPEISGKWRKTPAIRRPFMDMGSPQVMFLLETCNVIWPFHLSVALHFSL